jgi:hypothetical protein
MKLQFHEAAVEEGKNLVIIGSLQDLCPVKWPGKHLKHPRPLARQKLPASQQKAQFIFRKQSSKHGIPQQMYHIPAARQNHIRLLMAGHCLC